MKPRFIFWTFNLVAVILTASCAPAAVTEPPAAATIPVEQSTSTAAPTPLTESTAAVTDAPTIQPIATSRGPSLEATDPSTVSLASGQLQLVEFFRFTWGTCRTMAPMVHGLEAEYFGRIRFTYLDADDPQTYDFQRTLGFFYQPEVYLLDGDGNVLMKWVGYTSEEEFEAVFAQYVQ